MDLSIFSFSIGSCDRYPNDEYSPFSGLLVLQRPAFIEVLEDHPVRLRSVPLKRLPCFQFILYPGFAVFTAHPVPQTL